MRSIPVRAADPVDERVLGGVSMAFEACHTLADLVGAGAYRNVRQGRDAQAVADRSFVAMHIGLGF